MNSMSNGLMLATKIIGIDFGTMVLKEHALLPTPLVHAAMKHAVGCQAWWGISSLALSPVMTSGEIVNAVLFTMLVLNLTQEELGIVVAILELTAVRVDAAAHQMQAGVIFVAECGSLFQKGRCDNIFSATHQSKW